MHKKITDIFSAFPNSWQENIRFLLLKTLLNLRFYLDFLIVVIAEDTTWLYQ